MLVRERPRKPQCLLLRQVLSVRRRCCRKVNPAPFLRDTFQSARGLGFASHGAGYRSTLVVASISRSSSLSGNGNPGGGRDRDRQEHANVLTAGADRSFGVGGGGGRGGRGGDEPWHKGNFVRRKTRSMACFSIIHIRV